MLQITANRELGYRRAIAALLLFTLISPPAFAQQANENLRQPGQLLRQSLDEQEGDGADQRLSPAGEQRRSDPAGTTGQQGQQLPFPDYSRVSAASARAEREQSVGERLRADQVGQPVTNDDPFAAQGLRFGSFLVFPTLTQTGGYTSNADAFAGGDDAWLTNTEVETRFESQWDLHSLTGGVSGSWQEFHDSDAESLPEVDANATLRLDLARDRVARFGWTYNLVSESPTSVALVDSTLPLSSERPLVHTLSGFGEIERVEGHLTGRLRGSVEHTRYGDLRLENGASADQSARNSTLYQGTARIGLGSVQALRPFLEAGAGLRRYTESNADDDAGADSSLASLKAGLVVSRGEKLTGEFSIGYGGEFFDEGGGSVDGLVADADFTWSPARGTRVRGTLATSFNSASGLPEDASQLYDAAIELERDLSERLSLSARVSGSWQDFRSGRNDQVYSGEIGATYQLNRNVALVSRVAHVIAESSEASANYDATTIWAGIRLRR